MTVGQRIGVALLTAALALALAGCTAKRPAPVEDRAQAPTPTKPAPAAPAEAAAQGAPASADTYVVKRGDTLYSIALDNGVDWRELAGWNQIADPSRLQIGQVLRVRPPPGPDGVTVNPIAQAPPIAARPLGAEGAAAASPAAPAGGLRTEPKGVRLPYSDENLAAVQRADTARVAVAPKPEPPPAVAAVKPEPPPATKPEPLPPAAAKPESDGADEPVDWAWPATGKLAATFNGASNKGIDIAGRTGDPVHASAPGKVVYSGEGIPAYGKLVIIRHNGTYLSAYAHNSQILVKEGQAVAKGQKIAEVGSSGSESPRLHFEIRRLGKPVDPLQYLPNR
jgi:lipoprotein NlpD